jgi:hypothetical protein
MAFKMKGFPMQQTTSTKKKQWYVDNYEKHKGKEGYQEAMDEAFGGKTTVKDGVSTTTKPIQYKAPLKQVDPTFGQKIGKNKVDLGKYVLDISSKTGQDFFEKYKNIKTVSSSEPSRVGKTTAEQLNIPEGNKSKIRNILKKTTKLGGKVLGNLVKLAGGSLGALAQFMLMPIEAGASEAAWQKENLERQMKWLEEQQQEELKKRPEEGREDKIIIE